MPPVDVEVAIIGSLGVVILVAPNIAGVVQQTYQVIRARVVVLKDRVHQTECMRKLRALNRQRSVGSLVRVIGSLLPSSMFTPPCRIYIPNWAQFCNNQWAFQPQNTLLLDDVLKRDLPSENEVGNGLIEAFEVGSEVLSSVSDDDENDDNESESSTPEGWTQEQRRLTAKFNPTINVSCDPDDFARCSTPKGSQENILDSAQVTSVTTQESKIYNDQTEISELKKMVEGLMIQLNCLNQNLLANRSQPVLTVMEPNVINPTPSQGNQFTSVLPPLTSPVPTSSFAPQSGPPPPPPPPPPPMPPMPAVSKPLVITRKGDQDKLIQKKPQVSLSDVLKELPNAKLRRVERSPGGTPLRPLKLPRDNASLDIGDQLAFALKKRYESMHSPACDTDTDKENFNGSDDSFEDSPISSVPIPAKRALFPQARSPRRRSSNGKQSENRMPFGQHLLKKRIPADNISENTSTSTSPLIGSPFRQQN